jgi:putative thioredoxin
VLEREAAKREGKVVLAKLDTDANPAISQAFGIQGIPAVKAFRDGRVVDEFVGAQPPPKVERFFDGLVPSEADALVQTGDEASLRRAVELEPRRADAAVPLARLLLGRGEVDEALELVEPIVGDFSADGLAARIRLQQDGDSDLQEAFTALDAGDVEGALDKLLESLAASADGARDDLRRAIVGVLDELGAEDPRAREYRRRLAAALY